MKYLFVLIALSMVFLLGCVSDDSSSASNSLAVTIQDLKDWKAKIEGTSGGLQTWINRITTEIDKKALKTEIEDLNRKVNNIQPSTPADVYTKAQVDQKIADAISALKTGDQSWIKATSGTNTNTNVNTGTGTVNVLTSPTSVQILGNSQLCYTAKIQNTWNQWVYVRPIITINAASGQSPTTVTSITITAGGQGLSLSNANFQFTPTMPTATTTSSITCIPISGGNGSGEIQIAANTTIDLLICIQVNAANPIIWNIGTSVNSRTL